MTTLHTLKDSSRGHRPARKRVGRGPGSGLGKNCGRGFKGMGSRAGCKGRQVHEGGQMRLHMKLPLRGFNNISFNPKLDSVNISEIDMHFNDGDVVNEETLREKGLVGGRVYGIKILGRGELTKKLKAIEVNAMSASAQEKFEKAKISVKLKTKPQRA